MADNDEVKATETQRPVFCTPADQVLKEEDISRWSFGVRPNTMLVCAKMVAVSKSSNEGWIPICTGGRTLGFHDGDYDFIFYHRDRNAPYEELRRSLMALSTHGQARKSPLAVGELINIPDLDIGPTMVKVDAVITKDGPKAYTKVVLQGLFWEKVLEEKDVKAFFSEIRERAKTVGLIGGSSGFLNTWSIMITGLEWLILCTYIGMSLSKPLATQEPTMMGMGSTETEVHASAYFHWLADRFADPNHVFGSFTKQGRWMARTTSEFAADNSARVCRDPFSLKADNCMRCVQGGNVDDIVYRARHAGYCMQDMPHVYSDSKLLDRPHAKSAEVIDCFMTGAPPVIDKTVLATFGNLKVAYTLPRYSYGLSLNETDARSRAIINADKQPVEGTTIIFGPAMRNEFPAGITIMDLLRAVDRLYSSGADNLKIWYIGACKFDCNRDAEELELMDRNAVEALLTHMAFKAEGEMSKDSTSVWFKDISEIDAAINDDRRRKDS